MHDADAQAAIVRPERWWPSARGKPPAGLEALYRESFQMADGRRTSSFAAHSFKQRSS